MSVTTSFYDEDNLSGLGKEIAAEIEAEAEYVVSWRESYYGEADRKIEVESCCPTSIRIHPLEIPESKDSVLFLRLMNFFDPNHKSQIISPEDLDEKRRESLQNYCNDHANDGSLRCRMTHDYDD